MEDIRRGRVRYLHDGSSTSTDQFEVSVSDSTNQGYLMEDGGSDGGSVHTASLSITIDIAPEDKPKPNLVRNSGILFLKEDEDSSKVSASNLIVRIYCPFRRRVQLFFFLFYYHLGAFQIEDFANVILNNNYLVDIR